jgi:hypothetical protein
VKITFEGDFFSDIVDQMRAMVTGLTPPKNISQSMSEKPNKNAIPLDELVGPGGPGPEEGNLFKPPVDKPVAKPVEKPVDKPKLDRVAAMNKARAAKEAKKAGKAAAEPAMPAPPPPKTAEGMDPAEMVKIRQKTIEDLQSAYANGFQKEVFELLSRFGNGAKSFRELPPDAFVPIREAIDNGALTQ